MVLRVGTVKLAARLKRLEKTLTILLDEFLRTNRRVDRDKVIKKREEIRTIKYILDEYI